MLKWCLNCWRAKKKEGGYGTDARLRVIRHPDHPDNRPRLDSKSPNKENSSRKWNSISREFTLTVSKITSFHFLIKVYLDGAHSLLKLNSSFIPESECFTSTLAVNIGQSDHLLSCLSGQLWSCQRLLLCHPWKERSSDSSDEEREEE